MGYETKEGEGSLFKNDKRKSDKSPTMTGKIRIEGITYRLVAWTKGGTNGRDKFLSLKAEPMDDQPRRRGGDAADADDETDLPF